MHGSKKAAFFIAAAALLWLVYKPGMSGEFLYDDFITVVYNRSVHAQSPLKAALFNPFRSLVYLTYDAQYHIFFNEEASGPRPGPFHVFNLFAHLANGLMLFLLAGRLFKKSGPVPMMAAAVFIFHPLCTEAVNFISARFTLMAAFFYMGAAYFFLDPASRRSSRILFWLFFLLGLICKETVATLPVTLIILDRERKDKRKTLTASFVVVGIYVIARFFWPIILSSEAEPHTGPLGYFLAQNKYIWLYVFKTFYPLHLNFDYDAVTCSARQCMPFLVLNAAIAFFMARAAYRGSAFARAACVFVILLIPTSSFMPLNDLFRESRAYLPTAVTACIIAWLYNLSGEKKLISSVLRDVLFGCLIFLFCALSYERNNAWKSPAALWRDTAAKSAQKHRPVYNYGNALRRELRLEEALVQYERALKLDPQHGRTIRNIELVKKALVSPDLDKWKAELRSQGR